MTDTNAIPRMAELKRTPEGQALHEQLTLLLQGHTCRTILEALTLNMAASIAVAADDERHAGALTSLCAHTILGLMSDNWPELRAARGQWAGKVPHA